MDINQCRKKTANVVYKNNSSFDLDLYFGPIKKTNTQDGFCRVWKMKAILKGPVSSVEGSLLGDVNLDGEVNFLDIQPFIDALTSGEYSEQADINADGAVTFADIAPFLSLLSENSGVLLNAESIVCDDKRWKVYQYSRNANACEFMEVARLRCFEIPCAEPVKVCQCEKDETCDGRFFATELFVDSGRIRKMAMREVATGGIRQNVWTYRYYSNDLEKICELNDRKRILIKPENEGFEYRISSANFEGDCPYATVVREKGLTEIVETQEAEGG